MTPEFVTGFFAQPIKMALLLASPMLITALIVGLIISIFQTATQINEMTMTFVPKMLAVGIAILFFFPWMLQLITDFTYNVFVNVPMYVR